MSLFPFREALCIELLEDVRRKNIDGVPDPSEVCSFFFPPGSTWLLGCLVAPWNARVFSIGLGFARAFVELHGHCLRDRFPDIVFPRPVLSFVEVKAGGFVLEGDEKAFLVGSKRASEEASCLFEPGDRTLHGRVDFALDVLCFAEGSDGCLEAGFVLLHQSSGIAESFENDGGQGVGS